MAVACIGRRKFVPTVASTVMRRWESTRSVVVSTQERFVNYCTNGQHVQRWAAAAEKSKCFIPHRRRYGTFLFSSREMKRLSRSTGNYDYDLAVDKAIQHYHKHIKEEDGQNTMIYPVRGATECLSRVKMFHILLKTTGGQKYVCIYVAPHVDHLDDGALKLMLFRKLGSNVSLPFHKVVGEIRWPVCPRNDPLIVAAARFALAQHNKEEKLVHLVRANSQMVSEYEIFRMTLKGEFSGMVRMYDAIVFVPRKNPAKMDLFMFRKSDGWGMYGRLMFCRGSPIIVPHLYPVRRYKYDDGDDDDDYDSDEDEDRNHYPYQYEDDECVADDPRVTAAARFALVLYNETDKVRLGNKKDQVRRVVEATRRTYSGDEILNMTFDGELDGSWFYQAIVLVPVNDPENMRLAYCGRNYDDPDPYADDYEQGVGHGTHPVSEMFGVDEDECNIKDSRVTEAARLALAEYNKNDKLVRVVKAHRRISPDRVTYTVKFVGEDHPLRTYEAIVSAPITDPQDMLVEYVSVGAVSL